MIPLQAKVWSVRVLVLFGLVLLCSLDESGDPALALAIAWGPNGLFLFAYMKGALRLPSFLEPVHPLEPVLYRWCGVGFVKRIVATRLWPMLMGFEPPPNSTSRRALLDRTEFSSKGAEICHGATFVLVLAICLLCLAGDRISLAVWLLVFNIVLNGYPVMLQRTHRWRIRRIRAMSPEKPLERAQG